MELILTRVVVTGHCALCSLNSQLLKLLSGSMSDLVPLHNFLIMAAYHPDTIGEKSQDSLSHNCSLVFKTLEWFSFKPCMETNTCS
jgi:hypothetical protein